MTKKSPYTSLNSRLESPNRALKLTSSHSGPLASLDRRNAGSLRFVFGDTLILLRPGLAYSQQTSGSNAEPAPWPVLRGAVELELPKAKKVDRLEVELVNKYELRPPWGPTESGILFSKKQVIDASESSYYPAGTHHFMFEFPIDPQTPPYDNVSQGRIVQRVHARAPGVGAFGSDATASLRLVFAVVPSPLGELPPPLEWRHQAYSHDLGPYSLDIISNSLIVSALLNFRLKVHDPPQQIYVNGVFVSVAQSVHLRTSDGSFKQAGDPVELLAFAFDGGRTTHEMSLDGAFGGFTDPLKPFEARKSHTCTLQPGKPHEFACLAQLPDDTWLRPSTFPGTETPMEISHTLKVTVVYKHPLHQKDLRQLVMTRPVSIASCSSISSNLVLPEYGADAESDTLKVKPNVSQHNFDCACGMTLDSMVQEAHRSGLASYWDDQARSEPLLTAPK